MPSPMSPDGDDTNDLLKDELTDGAIETLYEIVKRAQSEAQTTYAPQSSRTSSKGVHGPSSALFKAYEQVLADQGLLPSDDAILHRFLFRMQENRRQDEGLVERFERVLGDMGIQVEVDEDGEGVEVTTNLERTRDATRNGAVAALGRHSRRSSFDSFFDGTADKVAGADHGDLPVRTRRGSSGGAPNGLINRGSQRRVMSDTEAFSYQQPQLPTRNRVDGYAHRRVPSRQYQPRRKRTASISSRGSLQIHRNGRTGTSRAGDYDGDTSEQSDHTTSLDLSHVQVPGINAPIPDVSRHSSHQHQEYVPEPFQPSDTRLLDDAAIFEEQRLHRVTRECIQTWRNRTHQQLSIRNDMEKLATAFDRKILLKLSFEQLCDTSRIQRSGRETERFFARLEERADKARNIFLLTKAFTHWAKSAEDEVQRTSVARRHILRTRFFNGWREITAVNELKTQHFVLGKFLRQWRARTATVVEKNQFAVRLYEENLVHRIYREWFFKFCAIAAPAWRNDRTRQIAIRKMNEIAKVLRERQQWAVDRWQRGVLRKTFKQWKDKTTTIQALDPRASDFKRTTLLSFALSAIRKQAQLAPLLQKFQEKANSRTIRAAFQNWQHTSQLARQARVVDQMRVLRNAYTAWNDRLRINALEDRINDRIIVECLYKWTLASRVSLFQRVHDRQQKESTFVTWVTKTNQRRNTLETAERRFAQFKRNQLLRTCLRRLEAVTAEKRAEGFAVIAELNQRLKQRIFEKLKERHAHLQQLNNWAGDARFYVLSKSTLKTWGEATQLARRNRRRDTYSHIRRTNKTNLVRRLFANWRDKSNNVTFLNQQANDMLENRTLQSSGSSLHQWRDRAIILRQQDTQATNIHTFKFQSRYLHVWVERMDSIQVMESQAIALRQESTELAATSVLKKVGWRLWNIQRQEENARALYERNFEKHVRAMLRFWAEQTNERLANRPVSPTPTRRSRQSQRDDDDYSGRRDDKRPTEIEEENLDAAGDGTHHLETWTALDEDALGLNGDLDLSLNITPEHQHTLPIQPRPQPSRSILRPKTYPQPHSALRPPPQTIPEDSILDPAFAAGLDRDLADTSTFWSGTPRPPPPPTAGKPGYLKTPSKRSVARAKRPELPASPEKTERVLSPVRGAMSAPPARRGVSAGASVDGVTSFQTRLREGGFSASVAGPRGLFGRGRARGKGRVGFGDVSFV
ncbi:Sfi1 spindle body protein-domain-containing protein [Phaeosphaeriaceae sp. PMI808]|nr:Sfi1 spindle body protein-domain-containing protein [Phaeosphaeriaceae sp. PMI808]